MKLSFTSQPIDKIPAELVVLMHYENEVPFKDLLGLLDWRINGRLSRAVQANRFKGVARELLLMPSEHRFKAGEILVLGLGKREAFSQDHISQVLEYFLKTVDQKRSRQVCLSLNQLLPSQFDWRNAVRLLLSKLVDYKNVKEIILREPPELISDVRRRQINFGHSVQVEYQ